MQTILCTTGTSIAGRNVTPELAADVLRAAIRERVRAELAQRGVQDALRSLSAETNSLLALKAASGDRVILLHTDTPDGAVCAEEIQRVVGEHLACDVSLHRIDGLQVDDPQAFRRDGIRNLFSVVDEYCSPFRYQVAPPISLNMTGGFKSVVPYLTLYGLLNRLPVVYLFERSQHMITLPPAPVSFDLDLLGRARDALTDLFRQETMRKDDFWARIPNLAHHDRATFECLLEEADDLVSPSSFARLLQRDLVEHQGEVRWSSAARKSYNGSSGMARDQFTFMLLRVRDPLWRKQKLHPVKAATDLTVFKPGRTSERMLARVEGTRVDVCDLMQHDGYEAALRQGRKYADYRDFEVWQPPQDTGDIPETSEEEDVRLDLWQEEKDEALARVRLTEERATSAESGLAQARIELDRRAEQLRSVEQEKAAAQARIAAMIRMPWWKRLWSGWHGVRRRPCG